MVLIIDNYDSFTYNLYHYFLMLEQDTLVKCRDQISIEEIESLKPDYIVLSPGPGNPKDAKLPLGIIDRFKGEIPILGVCLGFQCIGYYFGAQVIEGIIPVHGKVHSITHTNEGVFSGLKNPLKVTRYHSLVVSREGLPAELDITAHTVDNNGGSFGVIMGIRHRRYNVEGVQFHPEAILTEEGLEMLKNFLRRKTNEIKKA